MIDLVKIYNAVKNKDPSNLNKDEFDHYLQSIQWFKMLNGDDCTIDTLSQDQISSVEDYLKKKWNVF